MGHKDSKLSITTLTLFKRGISLKEEVKPLILKNIGKNIEFGKLMEVDMVTNNQVATFAMPPLCPVTGEVKVPMLSPDREESPFGNLHIEVVSGP